MEPVIVIKTIWNLEIESEKTMYISHLRLSNFKSFKGFQEFTFKSGKNFIVGNNNVGKTTIFEAIDFLFNGLKRNQDIDDLINNESGKDMYVEITYSDLSESIKCEAKLHDYITDKDELTLRRGTHVPTINTKGKEVFSDYKTLVYQKASSNKFYNPTGITNATKPYFNPTIVYANDHNEDYQDFKSSGLLGKLLKLEANDLLDSNQFKDVQQKFDDLINQSGGLQDHLNEVKSFMENTIENQFGKVGLTFNFKIPQIDSIIKNGRVFAEDKNGEQNISEKGSGLQRALVLAVIQAYSNFAKKADAMQFLIDEPELYMHPLAQDNLLNALNELSKKENQIFLNTHSPYILRHFDSDRDSVIILSNKPKERVRQMECLIFKPTSIGEITYKAFGVPTVDLHQRLYNSILLRLIYDGEDVKSQKQFAIYIKTHFEKYITLKKFRPRRINQIKPDNKQDGWGKTENMPLCCVVRNEIDHPEVLVDDTHTNIYSEDDLKESINQLFQIYKEIS